MFTDALSKRDDLIAEICGWLTQAFLLVAFLCSLFLTGRPLYAAWSFIFSCQLMRAVVLLKIKLPENLYQYLTSGTKFASGYPFFLYDLVSWHNRKLGWGEDNESPPDRFEDYGFENPYFLSRLLGQAFLWAVSTLLMILAFCCIAPICTKKSKFCQMIATKLAYLLTFRFTL